MSPSGQALRLLVADPDLSVDLDEEEAARARLDIVVPTLTVPVGEEAVLSRRSDHPGLIGFFVVEGLLLREIEVAGTLAAELLGAGDLIHPGDVRGSDLSPLHGSVHWTLLAPARLALLDGTFSARVAPWPQVLGRIALRAVWRSHGLALNLAISNQTRVEDRLLLLFWHLAQRWGRVGPEGVMLALPLTHETLSKLVGAKRPSVTSALGVLGERRLLERRPGRSWLLPLPIPERLAPLLSGRAARERAATLSGGSVSAVTTR